MVLINYRRNKVLRSRPRVHKHTSCSHLLKLMSPRLLPFSHQHKWKNTFASHLTDKVTKGKKREKNRQNTLTLEHKRKTKWQMTIKRCSTSFKEFNDPQKKSKCLCSPSACWWLDLCIPKAPASSSFSICRTFLFLHQLLKLPHLHSSLANFLSSCLSLESWKPTRTHTYPILPPKHTELTDSAPALELPFCLSRSLLYPGSTVPNTVPARVDTLTFVEWKPNLCIKK